MWLKRCKPTAWRALQYFVSILKFAERRYCKAFKP